MKIGIDLSSVTNQKTGFGNYASNLVDEILKIDHENDYHFFKEVKSNLSTPKRIWHDQFKALFWAKKHDLDILFIPAFSSPCLPFLCKIFRGKIIITCHDLIGLIFPQNFSFSARIFWQKLLPYSFKKANHILTVSENTKQDLIKYLKISAKKITATYEGADKIFFENVTEDFAAEVLKKYSLVSGFILSVGTIEPRKNYEKLILAYKKLKKEARFKNKLIIIGKQAWGYSAVEKLVHNLKLENDIFLPSYISSQELAVFYKKALFFVMPSLYEGFGLPLLEAMTCGTASIVSNVSSLPEIAGNAALLVDPNNVDQIFFAMRKLLQDSEREKLRKLGFAQAKNFSWQSTAKKTIEVFNKC